MLERSTERGPLVLVVESDARKREQIRRVFARHGYQVEAADGEREALAKVGQTAFDVALLSAHLTEGVECHDLAPAKGEAMAVNGHRDARMHPPGRLGQPSHPDSLPRQLKRLRPEMVTLVFNRRSYRRESLPTVQLLSITARMLREREEEQRNRRMARTFRETLLPQPSLSVPGYEIACVYDPGEYRGSAGDLNRHCDVRVAIPGSLDGNRDGLGGDFFDRFPLPDGRIGLMIGDVSGRGMEVASSTAMARFYVRAYAHQESRLSHVMAATNLALARDLPEERFVTLFLALLDPGARTLEWASAGHDPPHLLMPEDADPILLEPTGMALGIAPETVFTSQVCDLPTGSLLLLYTDGVTDPWERNGAVEPLPLVPLLTSCRDLSAGKVADRILTAARDEAGGRLEDDVSLIVLRGV